jgi:general secretion pathway protein H
VTTRATRARARGVTLIETLIAIALIAIVSGMAFVGMGALSAARLKRSTTLVASSVKVAYGYANASSKTVRLVFDFENRKILLEQSNDRHLLEKGNTGGAEGANELEKEAQAAAEALRNGPRAARAGFEAAATLGFDKDGKELPAGIRFWQVHTGHQDEPVSEGRAYLYFFPGGMTENASIQMLNGNGAGDDENDFMSVLIAPLTGRASITKGRVEMPEPRSEEEASERRDSGP